MKEIRHIVEDIQAVFAQSSYPVEFLAAYDQMECLSSHSGRETFLIQEKATGRPAVAKCYDRTLFPFQPDYSFLADLDHPGLPKFLGEYHNEQMLCIVREYIEGEPLSERAGEHDMSQEEILSVTDQLCGILEALHSHNPPIIHRDIKPENVIIRPDGTAVLIDFDISRSFKEHGKADTVFFGTRGYAAPEQYGFGQTDSRTDIFALGVLLRWMMTGSIRENKNITINADVQRIIDHCTAFSPDARYADAAVVRREVRAVKKNGPLLSLRTLLTLTLTALVFLGAGFAVGRYTEVLKPRPQVVFAEPVIERAARLQLGKEKGALTPEDLQQITHLYIYGSEAYADLEQLASQRVDDHPEGSIRTLDDLKMMPGLTNVHIVRQGLVDVSSLSELQHLNTLELKHMRISDLQPVAANSRLQYLVLFDTGLTDVTALEACPWLSVLDIGLNDIMNLDAIGAYPGLRVLNLMWLKLHDVNGIEQRMPRLETVMLQHSQILDLSGLKALKNLRTVEVLPSQAEEVRAAFADRPDVEIRVVDN